MRAGARLEAGGEEPRGRVPPHSEEAEVAILGAMLLERDAIDRVAEIVSPEDFYREAHRKIFSAILLLSRRGEPVDLVTLTEMLRIRSELADVGGATYLSGVTDRTFTAANAAYYARIVREKALLRRLSSVTSEITSRCYDQVDEVGPFLDEAEQAIFQVAERKAVRSLARISGLLQPALKQVEDLYQRQDLITGVPTGFRDLDELTAGLQRANLVVVAGRPSVGKTALCLNLAEFAAIERGIGVGIFSLEMSAQELVLRLLCSQAAVDLKALRTGRLRKTDLPKITLAAGRIDAAPIYIDDSGGSNVLELHARARRLARDREAGLGLVIVDYMQLVRPAGRAETREREIAEVSRSLKALAKDLDVPVVALSQLNRSGEKEKRIEPRLADLRDSGSIEQDADVIMFLYRKDGESMEGKERVEVVVDVMKQRNGPVGKVTLDFVPGLARFENPELFPEAAG